VLTFTAARGAYRVSQIINLEATDMGDDKANGPAAKGERAGETRLRGGPLSHDEPRTPVDEVLRQQSEDTDTVLRTDDEEDTLYEDGLELENGSRPLTGINGKDDSG
jgi:hypothetical protein